MTTMRDFGADAAEAFAEEEKIYEEKGLQALIDISLYFP